MLWEVLGADKEGPLGPDIVCWANSPIARYMAIDVATYHHAIAIHSYVSYRLVQKKTCTHARTHGHTHFTLYTISYDYYMYTTTMGCY